MVIHRISPLAGATDTLPHRYSSVAPGKEPGSRTEFSSDKDAADIHLHAYARGGPVARAAARRRKNCANALHGS
jgi:hypothetical protein